MEKRNSILAKKWDICNDILNIFRKLRGQELRSKTDNPYNGQEARNGIYGLGDGRDGVCDCVYG